MEGSLNNFRIVLERNKPYIAVVLLQVIVAGMALFTKAAIGHKGMKPSIFVVYRQAFATLSVAPFAFFLESKTTAQLSFSLLCKIFFVSFGITLTFNLYAYGLKYASATMAAASSNMVPVITFVLAVILRMEGISIKKWHGKAKVMGTIVCVCGAFVFAFVNGPPINFINSSYKQRHKQNLGPSISKGDLIKGSLALLSSVTTWSFWIVMQAVLVKQYPAKLRLITLQSFFSCIQAAIWAIAMERNISSWKIGWDINLLAVAYCGIKILTRTYDPETWSEPLDSSSCHLSLHVYCTSMCHVRACQSTEHTHQPSMFHKSLSSSQSERIKVIQSTTCVSSTTRAWPTRLTAMYQLSTTQPPPLFSPLTLNVRSGTYHHATTL